MESAELVLGSKVSDLLFVRLTFTRKNKPQWEMTEDFDLAAKFASMAELDRAVDKHSLSWKVVKVRPYTNALADWHKAGCPNGSR